MVLAFLRAERESSMYGKRVPPGRGWELLGHTADTNDSEENSLRTDALRRWRGYRANEGEPGLLFDRFPDDVEWWRVALSRDDIGSLLYGKHQWGWVTVEHGRRVSDGAAFVHLAPGDVQEAIAGIERLIARGDPIEPMIVVSEARDEDHVLLEGYKRATAYFRALGAQAEIEALAGYSPKIEDWAFR